MKKIITIISVALLIGGCAPAKDATSLLYESGFIYKADIHQGNDFNMSQVNQLKVGMNPQQIYDVMGPAMVHDPFHLYQWDYINSSSIRGEMTVYRVSIQFDRKTQLVKDIIKSGKIPK
jgi:outer membrane protein assembly factor BamE (lipoprotein component of BamABCDE complex)